MYGSRRGDIHSDRWESQRALILPYFESSVTTVGVEGESEGDGSHDQWDKS